MCFPNLEFCISFAVLIKLNNTARKTSIYKKIRWTSLMKCHSVMDIAYLFLKSSTKSCMFLSSPSSLYLSFCRASNCLFRLLMYASNIASILLLPRAPPLNCPPCSCRRLHFVSSTLFCCSRNRTYSQT